MKGKYVNYDDPNLKALLEDCKNKGLNRFVGDPYFHFNYYAQRV